MGQGAPKENDVGAPKTPRKRRRWWRVTLICLAVLIVLLAIGRALMPWAVRNYVNRTLDQNPQYAGRVGDVQIHLWRGAYSIHDVTISKTSGSVPVPFFAAKRVDFALQWNALLHHRVVGRIYLDRPELNFVDAPSEEETQTGGEGGPWLKMIRDLFPFKINSALIHDGAIHFRAYQTKDPLDVYLSHVDAMIDNLGNIRDELNPLVSKVNATGQVMDQAKLEFKMTFDPFSYYPTFHMGLRLLGLDVTRINELALAYGKFDFKRGWFDLVVEADSKEGTMSGYVKPLFRDLKVFSLKEDLKQDNILQFFWQALVGAATTLLKNQPRDQFGTLIPFTGQATGKTSTDLLSTIGNILRNAFIRAYLPQLEGGRQNIEGLEFQPPDLTEALSTADSS